MKIGENLIKHHCPKKTTKKKATTTTKKQDKTQKTNKQTKKIKEFYSSLNMGNIKNVGHRHAKKFFEHFETKNLGEYHDFYLQRDTLLLGNVSENFGHKI